MSLFERARTAVSYHTGNLFGGGYQYADSVWDFTKKHGIYKAVVPNFLYKPPFGFPLNKDVPEIRRLARTPYVDMIIRTIAAEISSLEWNIIGRDGEKIPDEIIKKTEDFFYNPNQNDESLDYFLRAYVRDLLEIDAGVIEKVWNRKDEFVEMYIRDGGTFTKNPNLHGVLPLSIHEDPRAENAYFQYGWLTGSRPIPFDRRELSYAILNPRSDSIYGQSPVEILLDVIQLLTYGIESNLEYFEDNNVPKGVLEMDGASAKDIEAFGKMWREQLRKKDPSGKWRRHFHKMPVMNKKGQFIRVGFSNLELELIEQQKWFTKIVWACFNITPSELGFTEDSNRATEVVQSNVFKRKAITPLVKRIEYHFNTDIITDLPWIKDTQYEGKVLFDFDKFDLQEELAKRQLYWGDIKHGLRTRNEIRIKELNEEPKEGGDSLDGISANIFGFQDTDNTTTDQFNPDKDNPAQGTKKFGTEDDKVKKKLKEKKALTTVSRLVLEPNEELTPERITKEAEKDLNRAMIKIKELLKREAGIDTIKKLKALDLEFTKRVSQLIDLSSFKEAMAEGIRSHFFTGVDNVGKRLGRNFIPNNKAVAFLNEHVFDNITAMEDEIKAKLRAELQRGLIQGEGLPALTKRVEKVLDVPKSRAAMIARTEVNRAKNMGELDAWKQSGKPGIKEWYNPSPEHPICVELAGSMTMINEQFKTKAGEVFDSPPAHPNCRSLLKFHTGERR